MGVLSHISARARNTGLLPLLALAMAPLATLGCGLFTTVAAQDQPGNPQPMAQRASPRVFEDDQVKVLIPPGWTISEGDSATPPFLRVGRHLQLVKNGYTLSLAYDTQPQSGVTGDRFTQVFAIPWLAPAQTAPVAPAHTEGCAFSLRRNQQPASASLLFIGFLMDTADARVRVNCAIQTDLGARWFAGFFTIQNGGYFLHSSGAGCSDKVYALSSQAKTADQLPASSDPALKAIIGEAGRIVNFIQYKRCALAVGPN